MHVVAIMATCGRNFLARRSVRMFLDQDYTGEHTLIIYNNSDVKQRLILDGVDDWIDTIEGVNMASSTIGRNKVIVLVNRYIDSKTGEPYQNLGAIYNDALEYVPGDADILVHWDDDDLFLPGHLSEGVKGLQKYGKTAYKPEQSYFRHPGGIQLMGNNLEPSVFVKVDHMKKYKYSLTTSDQHMQWFNPLLVEDQMTVDKQGKPTLIYNWGDTDIPTFKTSGNAGNPQNFDNYRNFSTDHGDGVIIPWSEDLIEKYYNLVM